MDSLLKMLKSAKGAFHCASYVPLFIIMLVGAVIAGKFGDTTYRGEGEDVTCTIAGEPTVDAKDVSSCFEGLSGKHFFLFVFAFVLTLLVAVKTLAYFVYVGTRVADGNPDPVGQYQFTVFQSYMIQLFARIVILVIALFVQLAKFQPTKFGWTDCYPHSKGNTTSGPLHECKRSDLFWHIVAAWWSLFIANLFAFIFSVSEISWLFWYKCDKYPNDECFFRGHLHIKVKETKGLTYPLLQGNEEAQRHAEDSETPLLGEATAQSCALDVQQESDTDMQDPRTPLLQQQASGSNVTNAGTMKPRRVRWPLSSVDRDAIFQESLMHISKNISGSSWQYLARCLGLDMSDQERILYSYTQSSTVPEKNYQMLMLWRMQSPSSSHRQLIEALLQIGRNDLAIYLEEKLEWED